MKYLIISIVLLSSAASCKESDKPSIKKNPLLFGLTLQGNVQLVEDSLFVVDAAGNHIPDSISYGLSEWSDGYLEKYTDIDSTGKKKTFSTYTYFPDRHLKSIMSELNGKTIYRLEVQLDENGALSTAQSYDSTGKMDAYNTDLKETESGQLISGKLFAADSSLINTFSMEYAGRHMSASKTWDSTGRLATVYTANLRQNGEIVSDTTLILVKTQPRLPSETFNMKITII